MRYIKYYLEVALFLKLHSWLALLCKQKTVITLVELLRDTDIHDIYYSVIAVLIYVLVLLAVVWKTPLLQIPPALSTL